jgi:hypothetical protein
LKISKGLQEKYISAAIILLAVGATVLIFYFKNWYGLGGRPNVSNELPKGYEFIPSVTGELPVGFPKELVLFRDAKILRGESTVDGTGVSHKITEYSTNQSSADVAIQYQTKLPALGWKLSGDPISQGTLQILNFTKDKTTLTAIISFKTATSAQISLDLKEGGK